MVPESVLITPAPVMAMPRFSLIVNEAVVLSVPPLNVILPLPKPAPGITPIDASLAILVVPAFKIRLLELLEPESTTVPAPELTVVEPL